MSLKMSLSARRAWIEMLTLIQKLAHLWSLSARRAWIEIAVAGAAIPILIRRSPQGERG